MNATFVGSLQFGLVERPDVLPAEWTWATADDEWVTAISAEGLRYFAQKEHSRLILFRQKIADQSDFDRTLGRLKIGELFMDGREKVIFQ